MSRRVKLLKLTIEERKALEQGYRHAKNKRFGQRCHIILLKATERSAKEIGDILCMTDQSVNNWVKRYEAEGIEGLMTRPGQGRPRILDQRTDSEKVKAVVKKERQRLKLAKQELETELDKTFSMSTLTRFLKLLAAPTDGSG